jgi:hypothetical protein
MNFLIDLFKKAPKGDSYRIANNPTKYDDQVAVLNAGNKTNNMNVTTTKLGKLTTDFAATSKGAKLPTV